MAEIGVMVYGFSQAEADELKQHLERINKEEVLIISACGREEDLVGDILEDEEYHTFIEKEDPRVIMFLGFDGPRIHATMDDFPKMEGKRPIFCTPTEKNIGWKLSELLEDLMEEREYFRRKQAEKKAGNPEN